MLFLKRHLAQKLHSMGDYFPVLVVSGARQVGKTTLLREALPNADYVVFDSIVDVENARQEPDLFLDNHPPPLILDEVQYAPEVVSALKRRVDRQRTPGSYFLTGSQQWGVLKSLSESLAGRAVFVELDAFALEELAESEAPTWLAQYLREPHSFYKEVVPSGRQRRTLYEQLFHGWFPAAQELPSSMVRDFYTSYLRTYIERDLRLTADISNYQQFGKFFLLAAALSGKEINHSQLGREIGVTPQTSSRWLDLLAATYQWFEIPAYTRNAVKRVSGRAKGFVADTGLMCTALALSSPAAMASNPALGALYETAVVGEIRKLNQLLDVPAQLWHWRAHTGAEVDLLLERDGKLFPLEIKCTARPTKADARGILTLRKDLGEGLVMPGLVLCQCENTFPLAPGVWAVPFF